MPNAGDGKKAIDEYSSEIFMGGEHTFVSYNVCEDSLLAAGIIIDLIVLGELMTPRTSYLPSTRMKDHDMSPFSECSALSSPSPKLPKTFSPRNKDLK